MDPISAVVFSMVVSWAIMRAAAEAGVDQARAEARRTAEGIRKDLQKRRKTWAKQLERRLADGRKGGPATALWWGWATMRTAKGLRRVMRREPRAAEKAIGGKTGPFSRIFGAAWRGAQYARDEARRQRAAHEKKTARDPVGVCGRCGAVAAKTALAWALTRFGRQEQMCAKCRTVVAAEREADRNATDSPTEETAQEVVDADIVPPPEATAHVERSTTPQPKRIYVAGDRLTPPGWWITHWLEKDPHRMRAYTQFIDAMDRERARRKATDSPPPASQPETAWTGDMARGDGSTPLSRPKPVEAAGSPAIEAGRPTADNTTPEGEGMPRQLAPARGGALATRNTAMTRRGGGDSYTHGQWNRATVDIRRRLEMLPSLLEATLASLNHADAGRTQVTDVMAFREDALNLITEITAMLIEVNRREIPMVEAVTTAGGPNEIPNIGYFREI